MNSDKDLGSLGKGRHTKVFVTLTEKGMLQLEQGDDIILFSPDDLVDFLAKKLLQEQTP